MRLAVIIAALIAVAPAIAEEDKPDAYCRAAADRLATAIVDAMNSQPNIKAKDGAQESIAKDTAARMQENFWLCGHFLHMPQESIDALGMSIARNINENP